MRHDEADLLGQRNERRRAAPGRFSGWCQRISASKPLIVVGREIDDRLVVELELAGGERLAQVVLHRAPRLHLRVHLRLEEAVGAAPVALGAIERQVGIADQLDRGRCRPIGAMAMPTLVPITTWWPSIS